MLAISDMQLNVGEFRETILSRTESLALSYDEWSREGDYIQELYEQEVSAS